VDIKQSELYLWECRTVQPLTKAEWKFHKNSKIRCEYDRVILLLYIYPKEMKSVPQRDNYFHFHYTLLTVSKI
jgi:hypothetical protein